jgi:hypothetical protein
MTAAGSREETTMALAEKAEKAEKNKSEKPKSTPRTKQKSRARQDKPRAAAAAAAGAGQRAADALRTHLDAVGQISTSLNEQVGEAYREWVAGTYTSQADYQRHLDEGKLQQALQDIGATYWNAVRGAMETAAKDTAGSHRSYLSGIKAAVAALDVESADAATLASLAQSLGVAACHAAGRQQQQQQEQQAAGTRAGG